MPNPKECISKIILTWKLNFTQGKRTDLLVDAAKTNWNFKVFIFV